MTPPRPTALFVYGTLVSGHGQAELLDTFALGRERATTHGEIDERRGLFPVARFGDSHSEQVAGELVRLDPVRLDEALEWLDRYEGPSFRRVVVRARTEAGEEIGACAYEWIGESVD